MNKKNILFKISKVNPNVQNIKDYKAHKNSLTSLLRNAERKHYEREFELNSNNLRKSWTIINDVIGRSNKNCNVSNEMIINNKLTSDKQFIANGFSIHYSTIGCKLANEMQSRTDPMHYVSYPSHSDFTIPTITSEEVQHIICSLNDSSPGYDDIRSL